MNVVPVSKIKIENKLAFIREALSELKILSEISQQDFLSEKKNFALAEHYLRRALEAIFDIAGHIASRYPMSPAKRPASYKELAFILTDKNIVDKDFGNDILIKMAGYRNRMVHFYDEITQEEMYNILQTKLTDIETFIKAITHVLRNPDKFNLVIADK